ncbi:MAG: 16S rRNA (uracil(1498)-N(3))-methyltransferase [Flavobacteriales bacterium]
MKKEPFYAPEILNDQHHLDEKDSKHATKVMRLKKGDELNITDGVGGWYRAKIATPDSKKCAFEVIEKKQIPKNEFEIHVLISPLKKTARFEWLIEKATELGVDKITPVLTKRTVKQNIRRDRMERIAASAMKQSMSAWLPIINEPVELGDLLEKELEGSNKLIGNYNPNNDDIQNCIEKNKDTVLLIGPEGGFTESEIEMTNEIGFRSVNLSDKKLRSETAALYGLTLINSCFS